MKHRLMICFIGVDGSGKTTHAKSLVDYLLQQGYSAKYVRIASRPILSYAFMLLTRILGYWHSVKKEAWTDPLEKAPPSMKKLAILYRSLLFVDFEVTLLAKLRLPMYFTQVMICDRYVYDVIMELDLSRLHSDNFNTWLLHIAPVPHKVFLAETPTSILAKRRANFPVKLVQAKQNFYRALAKSLNAQVLDTSDSYCSNQQRVRNAVICLLKGKRSGS